MINSQNVKIEGNTIEEIADGEIIQQANWITSFLNSGRFEFIALFNMTATSLTGQFSIVKGCIIDITTDLPFPAVAPPTQIRISVGQTKPSSMADILAGSQNSFHAPLSQHLLELLLSLYHKVLLLTNVTLVWEHMWSTLVT